MNGAAFFMWSPLMRLFLAAACLAALFSGTGRADIPPPAPQDDARETVLAFLENINAGSLDGAASTLADRDDVVWVENGRVTWRGKAEATGGLEAMLKTPGLRLETNEAFQVIALGGGGALAVTPVTVFVQDETGAEQAMAQGVMTFALARQTGEWRIVSAHTSVASGAD